MRSLGRDHLREEGLRQVDLRGAAASDRVELTGDQARISLLGRGLRWGDRCGIEPVTALLVDARGWM